MKRFIERLIEQCWPVCLVGVAAFVGCGEPVTGPQEPSLPMSPERPRAVVGTNNGSCLHTQGLSCRDYNGSAFKALAESGKLKSSCELSGVERYSPEACSSKDYIYACYLFTKTSFEAVLYIYRVYPPGEDVVTLEEWKRRCSDLHGTMVPNGK